MMNLEVNGVKYEGFKASSATKSMETAAGCFSFSAAPEDVTKFPIKKRDPCRVLVNDAPVVTGYIEKVAGNWGNGNDILEVAGRDRTGDFIDSAYEGNLEIVGPIHLKAIIDRTLRNNGFGNIFVVDSVGNIPIFKKEVLSGAVGEKCFEFCERFCRTRQVLLTCNGAGNLVITRASAKLIKTVLLHELNGTKNNVKSASYSDDDSERFHSITCHSQINASMNDDGSFVDIKGKPQTDKDIRLSRKLIVQAESPLDTFTATQRAAWEVNVRRARGLTYNCIVYGHSAEADGRIWEPNMLVQVIDERAKINAQMLIKEVTYSESEESGSETSLSCVSPDAFTLAAEMEAQKKTANDLMSDYEGME